MKVGDLIRVLPRRYVTRLLPRDWSGQLGVIIAIEGNAAAVAAADLAGRASNRVIAQVRIFHGPKVWFEIKRLEVQSETR